MIDKYNNGFETLNQTEAVALWRKGREAWNKKILEKPQINIDFSGYEFSEDEYIDFLGFIFPEGTTDFNGVIFSADAKFTNAQFIGDANFKGSKFIGDSFFNEVAFSGIVDFRGVAFSGAAIFTDLNDVEDIEQFSFKYAVFDGAFGISSDGIFPCLIDLTHTKTAHHVSLDGLKCTLPRKSKRKSIFKGDWITHKTATDKDDIARARRLKELAETNKDHQRAQDFHVLEMQAKREFNSKFPYAYLFKSEFWFEKLGDYGRSITRPLYWLLGVMVFFTGIYASISYSIIDKILWLKSLIYSVAQMPAFIPASSGARNDLQSALFNDDVLEYIYLLTFAQSLIALILLFLFGLAMRHRYRI